MPPQLVSSPELTRDSAVDHAAIASAVGPGLKPLFWHLLWVFWSTFLKRLPDSEPAALTVEQIRHHVSTATAGASCAPATVSPGTVAPRALQTRWKRCAAALANGNATLGRPV